MNTEIATINPAPNTPVTTEGLDVWEARLTQAATIGNALCRTAFVPDHYRGKPEEAAAAILFGYAIGFNPTQALQSIAVIKGKPSLYARSMVALVLSRGHSITTVSKTDASVTVSGQRLGSTDVITETWDIARATKAGYTSNAKYKTDPQAMLYARAASDVCRQIAPDVLSGLTYSTEEMSLVDIPQPARTPQARPTTIRAAITKTPTPEMVVDTTTGEILDAEIVDDTPPMATKTQRHQIAATLGTTDPGEIAAALSASLGREISSGADLTAAEAEGIIESLGKVTA
jgi:hypothetical protein